MAGKTKFAESGKLSAASDVKLTHTVSPTTDYSVTQKSTGNTILDGNFHIVNNGDLDVSLHSYSDLKQGEKTKWTNRLLLRAHLPDLIVSFGFVNFDAVSDKVPNEINVSILKGRQTPDYSIWGGVTGFVNAKEHHLSSLSLLGVYRDSRLKVHVEPTVSRALSESGVVNKLSARVLGAFNCSCEVKHNLDWKWTAEGNKHEWAVSTDYTIDERTSAKLRLDNNRSLSIGVKRQFGSFVNFAFSTQLTPKRGLGSDADSSLPFLSYRLGAQVELKE